MLLFAARVWPYSRVSINLSRNPFRPPPPIHTCVRDRFPVGGAQRVPWYKGKTQERKQSVNRLTSSRLNGHLSTKTALAGSQPPPHHGRPDVYGCWSITLDTGVGLCTRSKKGEGKRGNVRRNVEMSLPSCSWLVLPFRNESRNLGVLWANTNVVTWILYTEVYRFG